MDFYAGSMYVKTEQVKETVARFFTVNIDHLLPLVIYAQVWIGSECGGGLDQGSGVDGKFLNRERVLSSSSSKNCGLCKLVLYMHFFQ